MVTFHRCHDIDFPFIDLDEQDDQAIMLLQSVSKNMEGLNKREVTRCTSRHGVRERRRSEERGEWKNLALLEHLTS